MKKAYAVIFTEAENMVLVEVPDWNILTEGKNIEDAIDMARDAIGISGISMQDHGEVLPKPSEIESINIEKGTFFGNGRSYVSLVDIDFDEYRRRIDNKAVRRNVTIPNWLNREAEKANLNVSRVLQDALIAKLGIHKN